MIKNYIFDMGGVLPKSTMAEYSMFNLKPQECFFIDDTEKNVISYFDTYSYQWYT